MTWVSERPAGERVPHGGTQPPDGLIEIGWFAKNRAGLTAARAAVAYALRSVAEVANACEDHGYAAFVGGINDFLVTHGTTGLCHTGRSSIHDHIQPITEGEKSITGDDGALQREFGSFSLDGGDAR